MTLQKTEVRANWDEDTAADSVSHSPPPVSHGHAPAEPPRRVHPIATVSFVPRVLAHATGSLVAASTLGDRDWRLPASVVALGLLWPHVARYVSLRSKDTKQAGFRALHIDGLLAPLYAGLTGLAILPAGILLVVTAANVTTVGGLGFLARTAPLMLIGLALGCLISGVSPLAPVSPLTTALVLVTAASSLPMAHYVNHVSRDLIFVRRNLRRAISEISSIAEVARTVNSTLDEQHVLTAVDRALQQIFAFDQVAVLRLNPEGSALRFDAAIGSGFPEKRRQKLLDVRVPVTSAFGEVIRTRQPRYYADFEPEQLARMLPTDLEIFRINPIKSLLIVPLSVGDEAVGVICFSSTRDAFELTQENIESIERYVIHLATALRNTRLFEEVQAARIAADEANAAKSTFLATMSHELRTPLNGILGYAQLLQRDPGITPEQRQRLEGIEHSGIHLLGLINEVLDLSKIEAGGLEVDRAPTNLHALVQDVADIVRPRADSAGLRFDVEIGPDVPAGIRTDGPKLRQVVVNLLGNAVKFTQEGWVRLTVRRPTPHTLCLEVADSGLGIPAAQVAEIFEPFRQAEAGKTRGGTGLGLAISRRLVEVLGGELSVQSEPGHGSCFTIALPYEEVGREALADLDAEARREGREFQLAPGQDITVLVADDNDVNREILVGLLTNAGFRTVEAANGEEAVARQRERVYPLVLMDLVMPVMGGTEATQALRADPRLRDTVVVAVSASALSDDRKKALESGFDDFIAKPFKVSELFLKIEKHLGVRYASAEVAVGDQGKTTDARALSPDDARELIARLRSAIDQGDLDALEPIGAELRSRGQADWGDRIVHHARDFDFDSLERVVSELAGGLGEGG